MRLRGRVSTVWERRSNGMKRIFRRAIVGIYSCLVGAFLSGCVSNYSAQKSAYQASFMQGNYPAAVTALTKDQSFDEQQRDAEAFLLNADVGTAALNIPDIKKSVSYLDASERAMLSQRLGAYRAKYYEKVMLNTYKALAFFKARDFDNARVEFNRAYSRQADAVEENKKAIQDAEQENEKQLREKRVSITQTMSAANSEVEKNYPEFKDFKAYSDFVNPFTTYLAGLFLILANPDTSDLDTGLQYLQRVKTMVPDNGYIQQDIQLAEQLRRGEKKTPRYAWVIYESGVRAASTKTTLQIPFYLGAGFKFAKINLPKLKPQVAPPGGLTVQTSTGVSASSQLVDIDRMVMGDFKERFPLELTKAIIWMTVNLAAQEVAQRAIGNEKGEQILLGALAGFLIAQVSNPVDTRCWDTLPKEVYVARVEVPTDNRIALKTREGAALVPSLQVDPQARYTLIHVRYTQHGAAPAISVTRIQ